MQKLRFVASLTTNDNDYQMEQAAAAQEAAKRLNVELEILYAENDAILQSQQLLKIIQSNSGSHPDGIIFEPVGGTALPQVELTKSRFLRSPPTMRKSAGCKANNWRRCFQTAGRCC